MPNRFVGAVALALICSVAAAVPAGAQKKDRSGLIELVKFQGTWKYVSSEQDGKALPKSDVMQTITFDGNTFKIILGDKVIQAGTLSLDPKAIPKTIVFDEGKSTNQLGIYEFKDDTLKVCYVRAGKNRPTEFKTTAGSGHFLAIMQEHDVIRQGISPKDPSIVYEQPWHMLTGFVSYNGKAYDKAALCVDPKTKLVVPSKDTDIVRSEQGDVVLIAMEKRMGFKNHTPHSVNIADMRRVMGCAVKLDKGELLIGTYGEFGHIEGACRMRLLILVPQKLELFRRDGLIGGAVALRGRPPELINPAPGEAIPALTKTKPATTDCWLPPTVEDGWHEIPAVADVERKVSKS